MYIYLKCTFWGNHETWERWNGKAKAFIILSIYVFHITDCVIPRWLYQLVINPQKLADILEAQSCWRRIHKEFMSHHKSHDMKEDIHVSFKNYLSFILLFYCFKNKLNLFKVVCAVTAAFSEQTSDSSRADREHDWSEHWNSLCHISLQHCC